MKVVLIVAVVLVARANAWFWGRNTETTATADGRGVDDACLAHGENGRCEFFDCFEQRLPCGRNFYMQRFGNHYCTRFQRYKATFTEAGQQFLRDSQKCVTKALKPHYQREYVNCHDLEHDAISLIGTCYRQAGFCAIIGDNTDQFLEVFQINDLFRSGSGKLWRELLGLARHCGGSALSNFMSRATPSLRSIFGGDDD